MCTRPIHLRPVTSLATLASTFALLAGTFAAPSPALAQQHEPNGIPIKLKAWVVDSACAYTKGLDKPIGVACAKACARNGSPLVLLTDDGTIYMPIDSATPSNSQNPKLLPYAGE